MPKIYATACTLFSYTVLAFISPRERIGRTPITVTCAKIKPRKGSGGGGFAKKQSQAPKDAKQKTGGQSKDQIFNTHFGEFCYKEDVNNLVNMFEEMQQSQKLPTEWIDSCSVEEHGHAESVIASKDVNRGQILTLLPIHGVGLRNVRESRDGVEYIEFNADEAEIQYSKGSCTGTKLNIPLNPNEVVYPVTGERPFIRMFVLSYPQKKRLPGWLGGFIRAESGDTNCVTLPIPLASPFCAIVATQDIKRGEGLVMRTKPLEIKQFEELNAIVEEEEHAHISLLRSELQRAFLGPFHNINLSYPGVKQLHKDPDVYEIDNFLTEDECDRIISEYKSQLKPEEKFNEQSGRYKPSEWRTHTTAKFSRSDPVIQKLAELAMIDPSFVDGASVLNYQMNQEVKEHHDYASKKKLKQFRIGVGFCYLNDVLQGGSTYFAKIGLEIRPRRGTLVVHFPADLKGRPDERTLHAGLPALDEKWLLVMTWSNNNLSDY